MAAVVTLHTSNGQSVEVVQALAFQSPTIKNMIQNNAAGENRVQVPNVKSSVLKMTMEFIEKQHPDRPHRGSTVSRLKDLVEVASRLALKELMEMASQKVADTMEGKSVAEIRQVFNIQNDYSWEEEEEAKKENPWPFLDN
ncbi:SKP1-like protein 11 [Aristolochia californica]|uniref:SKP1-like protein 11 n=1 Tax=Aristolochia californica TaxID=171875 RepID=UPI0035DB9981